MSKRGDGEGDEDADLSVFKYRAGVTTAPTCMPDGETAQARGLGGRWVYFPGHNAWLFVFCPSTTPSWPAGRQAGLAAWVHGRTTWRGSRILHPYPGSWNPRQPLGLRYLS